jgi:calcium-dependent protein kinase
MAPEFFN